MTKLTDREQYIICQLGIVIIALGILYNIFCTSLYNVLFTVFNPRDLSAKDR